MLGWLTPLSPLQWPRLPQLQDEESVTMTILRTDTSHVSHYLILSLNARISSYMLVKMTQSYKYLTASHLHYISVWIIVGFHGRKSSLAHLRFSTSDSFRHLSYVRMEGAM